MFEQIAKIESTFLGLIPDKEIFFALDLCFDFGGACQCLGYFVLDGSTGMDSKREVDPRGMTLVRNLLEVFGGNQLQDLQGRICYVLREKKYGRIIGIKTLPFDSDKTVLFADYFDTEEETK